MQQHRHQHQHQRQIHFRKNHTSNMAATPQNSAAAALCGVVQLPQKRPLRQQPGGVLPSACKDGIDRQCRLHHDRLVPALPGAARSSNSAILAHRCHMRSRRQTCRRRSLPRPQVECSDAAQHSWRRLRSSCQARHSSSRMQRLTARPSAVLECRLLLDDAAGSCGVRRRSVQHVAVGDSTADWCTGQLLPAALQEQMGTAVKHASAPVGAWAARPPAQRLSAKSAATAAARQRYVIKLGPNQRFCVVR